MPTNDEPPSGAHASLITFAKQIVQAYEGVPDNDDQAAVIIDLLCNLHHLADTLELNWTDLLSDADLNYSAQADTQNDKEPRYEEAHTRGELDAFSPEALAALAEALILAEDCGNGSQPANVMEAAEARAAHFGYDSTPMDIASDWLTASNQTWDETLAFLRDPACLQWLARLMLRGWSSYNVNDSPSPEVLAHAWANLHPPKEF